MTGIGELIRREREGHGLTLGDVSEATGIAVPNLSRIERSGAAMRSDTLMRIAAALNTEVALVPRRRPLTLADVRERALNGREAISDAGLAISDPVERLRRKADLGRDVSIEAQVVSGRDR